MIKVVLLGSGNVAFHLAKALTKSSNIDFVQHYSRNDMSNTEFNQTTLKTNNINNLVQADIYIIAITDDAIANFSKKLIFKKGLVVHTSGSMPLNTLQCKANKGVFYPIQTFTKNQDVPFKNIPIAIETEKNDDFELLNNFTKSISNNVYKINSSQREKLHIAAVFANNFSNQMYNIAKDICDTNNFSFDILKPLILETANKIQTLNPAQAQTGPAKRNNQKVIQNHISQLTGEKKEIYQLISNSIIKTLKN